jgi:hypothetical protein
VTIGLPEGVLEPANALRFREYLPALLETIGSLAAYLQEQYPKSHEFMSVSAQQADPFARVYAQWDKSGHTDPQPLPTKAEARAIFYLQGRPNAQIGAFLAVNGTALLEMLDGARTAFASDRLLVAFGLLRGVIERAAHAWSLACVLRPVMTGREQTANPLLEVIGVSGEIARALYGTKMNWMTLATSDLTKVKKGEAEYNKKDGRLNLLASSILSGIDRLDKKVAGTRIVYEILCEFLHPNTGDLFATTVNATSMTDQHGTRLIYRTIGAGPKNLSGVHELDHILAMCCKHLVVILATISEIHAELRCIHQKIIIRTQKYMRHALKKNRGVFSCHDLCPCFSGKQVAFCCGKP